MSEDELQAVAPEASESTQTTETPVEGSDSASDTGENQEQKVTFDERQQKLVDDLIGKKTFKVREAERRAEKLEADNADLRKQIPQEQRPEVLPLPDSLDYDSDAEFAEALKQRDATLTAQATYDSRQVFIGEQQQAQQQAAQQQQQEALQKTAEGYNQRATQLGVKPEELQVAGNTVAAYGIDEGVVNFILADDKGPLLTTYLAANPAELEIVRGLDPMSAAVYLSTTVKQKVEALKPKLTSTPDPVETLSGAGLAPQERGPKNATFE